MTRKQIAIVIPAALAFVLLAALLGLITRPTAPTGATGCTSSNCQPVQAPAVP